ncbi:hypothetical protein F5Y15DRAFT_411862 [Xylariaceae sp. FL0016]|nr:hypothetical protein F5Y15DRAFT_411862 [Xylariaceae sp. FL0016]
MTIMPAPITLIRNLRASITPLIPFFLALSHAEPQTSPQPTCMQVSAVSPGWRLQDIVLTTAADSASHAPSTLTFDARNTATNVTTQCSTSTVADDGTGGTGGPWYGCENSGAQFQFDFLDLDLVMRESWVCAEATDHFFTATGETTLDYVSDCPSSPAPASCALESTYVQAITGARIYPI